MAVTDEHAVVFDNVHAFSNGFTFDLVQMRNPNIPVDFSQMHQRPMFMNGPRLGFEFVDGSIVTTEQPGIPAVPGGGAPGGWSSTTISAAAASSERPGFDAEGVPTGHVLRTRGSGGSQYRQATELWCFRLPPPGPMTIHADWPDHFDEVAIDVDATPIVDAAGRSRILWPRT
ncbi:hypothetical protein [Rhabdothermincola salaria]|uniref:hypothetical protein n=1 Tax=Rhabdothermincola salaria TaxID=2903142 RepID=UPI001E37AF95|nr:hypothetical protein [Rhabdothermincola salaria]MCD9625003.1 hypothetical protein [Rhabdothermincola salaria]